MYQLRVPGLYGSSVTGGVGLVRDRELLVQAEGADDGGARTTAMRVVDKARENLIGELGLRLGLGLNFLVNGKDHVVPLVVEGPAIVAELSDAAELVRAAGGFSTHSSESLLIGQVHVVGMADPEQAHAALLRRKDEILALANSLQPSVVARGGGVRALEVHLLPAASADRAAAALHLLVDTGDAVGADSVETMCRGVAPLVESIAGGRVLLAGASWLAERALVSARVVLPLELLAGEGYDGAQVRDGIVRADGLAQVDSHRAVTHNKAVMDAIDAVALASGNDWRALEAAAHAHAARSGRYGALARWQRDAAGNLVGLIELPLKVGITTGSTQPNATVALNLRVSHASSARELAEIMAAVGLARSFSSLQALVVKSIRLGRVASHARSVAALAGAAPGMLDTVVERLVDRGDPDVQKARDIMASLHEAEPTDARSAMTGVPGLQDADCGKGYGKVILLGEHAVVYGRHALAMPVPLAIRARAELAREGTQLVIPRWGVEQRLVRGTKDSGSFLQSLELILAKLGLIDRPLRICVYPSLPRANGLGGSAALAVAVIRALDRCCALHLSDQQVSALAYECERIAHGTPSGIDNTVATYGTPVVFRRGEPPLVQRLQLAHPLPVVIGLSGVESLTVRTVARVREAWQRNPALYERVFDEIDALALEGIRALEAWDLPKFGELMNLCQGQLNALQVSSIELEDMIQIARANGALGAKLTGGGGGGAMIALCPDDPGRVRRAHGQAGYQTLETDR
jgi:hydroxymethylglutaryl-CoA reductase